MGSSAAAPADGAAGERVGAGVADIAQASNGAASNAPQCEKEDRMATDCIAPRALPGKFGGMPGSWLAFSPDSRRLAAADLSGSIHVWEVTTGRNLISFQSPWSALIASLCFSPDGRSIACSAIGEGGLGILGDMMRHLASHHGDSFETGSDRDPDALY